MPRMRRVNIHEAKTQLSRLISDVEKGEEIVIARYGEPVARLVPMHPTARPRQPGSAKGTFELPPSFFDPIPEEFLEGFGGE